MTAVGKILIFLVLVFSLLIGGLQIITYVARTNWIEEYNKLSQRLQVAQASEETYKKEAIKAQQDADARVAQETAQRKKTEADLQAQIVLNDQMRERLANSEKKSTQENSLATLSSVGVQKYQEDVSKLRESLKKETDLNTAVVKKNTELLEQATSAAIERQAALATNKRLEEQLQQMARDMARMRSTGGTAMARANGKNPPPENVEGLIKTTDSSGLMTITIGSDAGLTKGHTLEVFRLSPIPSQSKYLGTIRILEVTATQAVAQPVGRMNDTPKAGDRVASRIIKRVRADE
jgi:murein L,D-transpeptidase YcbB/YkuD